MPEQESNQNISETTKSEEGRRERGEEENRPWAKREKEEWEELCRKYLSKSKLSQETRQAALGVLEEILEEKRGEFLLKWLKDKREEDSTVEVPKEEMGEDLKKAWAIEHGAMEDLDGNKKYIEFREEIDNLMALREDFKREFVSPDASFLMLYVLTKKEDRLKAKLRESNKPARTQEQEIEARHIEEQINKIFQIRREIAEYLTGKNLEEDLRRGGKLLAKEEWIRQEEERRHPLAEDIIKETLLEEGWKRALGEEEFDEIRKQFREGLKGELQRMTERALDRLKTLFPDKEITQEQVIELLNLGYNLDTFREKEEEDDSFEGFVKKHKRPLLWMGGGAVGTIAGMVATGVPFIGPFIGPFISTGGVLAFLGSGVWFASRLSREILRGREYKVSIGGKEEVIDESTFFKRLEEAGESYKRSADKKRKEMEEERRKELGRNWETEKKKKIDEEINNLLLSGVGEERIKEIFGNLRQRLIDEAKEKISGRKRERGGGDRDREKEKEKEREREKELTLSGDPKEDAKILWETAKETLVIKSEEDLNEEEFLDRIANVLNNQPWYSEFIEKRKRKKSSIFTLSGVIMKILDLLLQAGYSFKIREQKKG